MEEEEIMKKYTQSINKSLILFVAVDFQWRVHEGDEQGLAQWTFLLLAVRRILDRTTLRSQGRASLLHQVLRERFR